MLLKVNTQFPRELIGHSQKKYYNVFTKKQNEPLKQVHFAFLKYKRKYLKSTTLGYTNVNIKKLNSVFYNLWILIG